MDTKVPNVDRRQFVRMDNRTLAGDNNSLHAVSGESESFLPESHEGDGNTHFGVGYGHSSGYVHNKPYTHAWGPLRFSIR
jgi:hypothetical protein